jgi:hypothetical protein
LLAAVFIIPPAFSVILHKAKKSTANERRYTPIDPETVMPVASVAAMGSRLSRWCQITARLFQKLHRRGSAFIGGFRGIWETFRCTGFFFSLHPVHPVILSKGELTALKPANACDWKPVSRLQ